MSQNAVSLVRVFCFQDGYDLSNQPIQSSPGVYDEGGLQRIDLILSQAAQYGIYVIVVPTNFEPVGGGMQWYVDQVRNEQQCCSHYTSVTPDLWPSAQKPDVTFDLPVLHLCEQGAHHL